MFLEYLKLQLKYFNENVACLWHRLTTSLYTCANSKLSFFQHQYLVKGYILLTHLPLVPHICVSESGQHWFRYWLVAYSAPSHYLNQCWDIINWAIGNKLQWNFDQNTKRFIHENASENIVCETASILSRGRRINNTHQEKEDQMV